MNGYFAKFIVCATSLSVCLFTGIGVAGEKPFPELAGPYFGQPAPGLSAQPFAEDILDPPDGYHSSLVFSPDGKMACWTGMSKNTYVSYLKDGYWTDPVLLSIDTAYGIGEPVFSPDGSKLFFLSRRPPSAGSVDRERIWYTERIGDTWGEPELIDSVVAAHPTHWQFSVAANGNLYFTSETKGVSGHQDIYVSVRDGNRYLEPVTLGGSINSEYRDLCPFVAPDESFVIFARTVPERDNRTDLFISFRDASGEWLEAKNMGRSVNSRHNEVCPVITPDGRYLFFSRVSSETNGLYWISAAVIDSLRKP